MPHQTCAHCGVTINEDSTMAERDDIDRPASIGHLDIRTSPHPYLP